MRTVWRVVVTQTGSLTLHASALKSQQRNLSIPRDADFPDAISI